MKEIYCIIAEGKCELGTKKELIEKCTAIPGSTVCRVIPFYSHDDKA